MSSVTFDRTVYVWVGIDKNVRILYSFRYCNGSAIQNVLIGLETLQVARFNILADYNAIRYVC